MKPSLKIPSALHARIMTQVCNLPSELLLAALKQLTPAQWRAVLEESSETSKSVQNRVYHLKTAQTELQSHLINQIDIGGVE